MKALYIVLVAFFAVFSGCSGIPAAMVASTSPLPPGVRGTIPTYASDCQFFLLGLGFLPLSTSIDTQDALQDAKDSANVDVLTDVTIDFGGGYYILFSTNCVRVAGLGVPRERIRKAMGDKAAWYYEQEAEAARDRE